MGIHLSFKFFTDEYDNYYIFIVLILLGEITSQHYLPIFQKINCQLI